MAEKTLDAAPNYAHVIEINITPDGPDATWAYALRGITECTPENEETVNEDVYYHNLGDTETEVEAVKVSIAMSGHRVYGDPCQDFVQSRALLTGDGRKTDYRWTQPDGTVLAGRCTLSELVPGSGMGEANAKGTFGYRINLNSIEEKASASAAAPDSVTVQDVTVAVGEAAGAEAAVAPEGANQKCHYAVADADVATVDSDGRVRGVKDGETTLVVKAAAKPSVSATAKVTVTAAKAARAK